MDDVIFKYRPFSRPAPETQRIRWIREILRSPLKHKRLTDNWSRAQSGPVFVDLSIKNCFFSTKGDFSWPLTLLSSAPILHAILRVSAPLHVILLSFPHRLLRIYLNQQK